MAITLYQVSQHARKFVGGRKWWQRNPPPPDGCNCVFGGFEASQMSIDVRGVLMCHGKTQEVVIRGYDIFSEDGRDALLLLAETRLIEAAEKLHAPA